MAPRWLRTSETAKVANALSVDGWETTSSANDCAYAGAGNNLSLAGLDSAGSAGLGGAAGSFSGTGYRRGGNVASDGARSSIACDGTASTLTLLLDGH
ncbi:hypothetical protein RRF57_005102 [Xylaria bambusicola]|uniref:Uncharacterized protein n=1 Tax=Xylaria bambusicola TaxID=326684 RepID=A0AAN7Z4G7_9PEZI